MGFVHANYVRRRCKVQLEVGGGSRDVSAVIGFNEFIKWAWKSNFDDGIHQRPWVWGRKSSKSNKAARGESTDG